MKQGVNPNEDALETARDVTELSFLTRGRVSSAPQDQTNGEHHISVQQTGEVIANDVPVVPTVHGDFYIPPEGAPVYLAVDSEGEYIAVASPIPDLNYETVVDPGERIISHPLSKTNIRFHTDGKTDIAPEVLPPPDSNEQPWRPFIKWLDKGEMTIKGDSGDDHWKPHIKFLTEGEVEIRGDTGDDNNNPEVRFENDGSIVIDGDTGPDHKNQLIRYNPDGSIDIESDDGDVDIKSTGSGTVKINDGTKGVVTDVTYDSANSEIVVHRNDTVQVPSGNTTERNPH